MRIWTNGPFTLHLWDSGRTKPHNGASILRYAFWHDGALIFEGSDFAASPLHAIDSDDAVYALLFFLSMRPGSGDVESEYFDDYTPAQRDWAQMYGEELSLLVYEHENPYICPECGAEGEHYHK